MLQAIAGLLALQIKIFGYITELGRQILMQNSFQGYPGLNELSIPWGYISRSYLQWSRWCRKPPLKVQWVLSKCTAATCMFWTQWRIANRLPAMTTKDWWQAQLADTILSKVIMRMQDRNLWQYLIKPTVPMEIKQLLHEHNQLKLKKGVIYQKVLLKESYPLCRGRLHWGVPQWHWALVALKECWI